jgi:hypothetical protein
VPAWLTAWLAGCLILGGAVLLGVYELSRSLGLPSITTLPTWALALALLGGCFIALVLATFLITGGEAILDALLSLIEELDRNTPTGGVGILGVAFLVGGFALQVAATWVG